MAKTKPSSTSQPDSRDQEQTNADEQCDICGMVIDLVLKEDASHLMNSDREVRICNGDKEIRIHYMDRSNGHSR